MMLDRLFHQSARWKIQGGNCSCSFHLSSYAYEGPTPRLKQPGLSRQTIVQAATLAGIDLIEDPSQVTCMIVHNLGSLPESLCGYIGYPIGKHSPFPGSHGALLWPRDIDTSDMRNV